MPVKGELWVNRILSILMIGVLLYTFFGNRQNVVDDMTQAEIDSKAPTVDVIRWDAEIKTLMKEEKADHQTQHTATNDLLKSMDRKIDILLTDK